VHVGKEHHGWTTDRTPHGRVRQNDRGQR